MTSTSDEAERIAEDYDESACEFCERYKSSGLSRSSSLLMDLIVEDGIDDKSVLDLGCGAGGFSVEALKRGGSNSVGIDLSQKMVNAANELAAANSFQGRAKFQSGNAATDSLPDSDIVVMDKVICCYSEVGPLLKNASSASRDFLGFVVPRDEGVVKWPLRMGVWIMNWLERRRGGILLYLHPLAAVHRSLQDHGFVLLKKQGSGFWLVFLYKRAQVLPGGLD